VASIRPWRERVRAQFSMVFPSGSRVTRSGLRKAYPVYDASYRRGLGTVRRLRAVPNLQLVGRNGMHRYNNQDHSMLTAILAARNVMGARYDLWALNVDPDYLGRGRERDAGDLQALAERNPHTKHLRGRVHCQ
jgi:hypothetical protein